LTLLTPFKLTPLGLFHTLVSIACVGTALAAVVQDHGIDPRGPIGFTYVVTLWITTLTGIPIFRHGKAGPPHVLGVLTVIALVAAALAGHTQVFGRLSAQVETVSYSLTVLLLLIPTVTETLTRVPPSAPWVSSPDAPVFRGIYSALVLLFLIAVTLQLRALRAAAGL
jgi:hypothetical protein